MPTDDIQVEQVGFYRPWMAFLHQYVTPLQQKVFVGHVREVSATFVSSGVPSLRLG